jgi:hypothetical protein
MGSVTSRTNRERVERENATMVHTCCTVVPEHGRFSPKSGGIFRLNKARLDGDFSYAETPAGTGETGRFGLDGRHEGPETAEQAEAIIARMEPL